MIFSELNDLLFLVRTLIFENPCLKFDKNPTPSKSCAAVKLFKKGASLSDVVIKLDLTADEAERFYADYWRLKRMNALYDIYRENKDSVPHLLRMHKLLEK